MRSTSMSTNDGSSFMYIKDEKKHESQTKQHAVDTTKAYLSHGQLFKSCLILFKC